MPVSCPSVRIRGEVVAVFGGGVCQNWLERWAEWFHAGFMAWFQDWFHGSGFMPVSWGGRLFAGFMPHKKIYPHIDKKPMSCDGGVLIKDHKEQLQI